MLYYTKKPTNINTAHTADTADIFEFDKKKYFSKKTF